MLIIATIVSFSLYLYNLVTCRKNLQEELIQKQKIIQKMEESSIQRKDYQNKIDLKLHDKLGANLSALNLHMSRIKKHVPEQQFNTINNLLSDSIKETRKISKEMNLSELINHSNVYR